MTFLEYSKEIIKNNGGRITGTRLALLELLQNENVPFMPYDIAKKLKKKGKKIDIVTVYRILESLEDLGLVHKTDDGYTRCQHFICKNSEHCHHQFSCRKCHAVEEIHVDDSDFIRIINKTFKNLLIESHNFRFSGLCKKCRKALTIK